MALFGELRNGGGRELIRQGVFRVCVERGSLSGDVAGGTYRCLELFRMKAFPMGASRLACNGLFVECAAEVVAAPLQLAGRQFNAQFYPGGL